MKMKRGKDSWWRTVHYKYDLAIYVKCKCGYEYACSSNKRNKDGDLSFEQEITKLYHYRPVCGARKKWYQEVPTQSEDRPIYMR